MLSKLAVKRLTKLADFMDALPPFKRKRFDMAYYCQEKPGVCGTVMCAAGWATTIPEFRRAGLRMTDGYNTVRDASDRMPDHFFGCAEQNGYEQLFSGHLARTIKTPKQWAAHCRKFIEANS